MIPLADVNFAEATWIMIVKSILIFLVVFMIVPVLTVVERKLIGRFQNRYGPNRVGPVGLMQPLADILKLLGKQPFRPTAAVPFLFALGPALVIISGIAVAFFLGGYHGPGPAWLDPIWMIAKILSLILVFIWVRATLPRLRYDQLMSLGWKILLPLATLNILVTAVLVVVL